MYYTYILECADATFYTWITTDLERRLFEHNYSQKAAKYTRVRRPVQMVYFESFETRSEACKREVVIKKMSREQKIALIKK